MKHLKLSLFAIGLVSVSGFVSAQGPSEHRKGGKPPSVEAIFSKMDMNQDSQLSEDEVDGRLKDDFSAIDQNSDGFITREELSNAPKPKRKRKARPNNE